MADWLKMASEAFEISTSYVDNNYRQKWEKNIRHFQSRHHADSKYHTDAYRFRSKTFRPKTRALIRGNEAAGVAAFFSTSDVVATEAQNPNDQKQQASSEVMLELLNYRLQKTIPWYVTCIGALQEGQINNLICSKQYWDYEEAAETEYQPVIHPVYGTQIPDEEGNPIIQKVESTKVVNDKPVIDLIPPEQIRFHPGADWRDPVNSSPFLIYMIPMYVGDVIAKSKTNDPKTGEPRWKNVDEASLRKAAVSDTDTTRSTRDGEKEEKYNADNPKPISEFDMVWVHENIFKVGGENHVYYTLGTTALLTTPKPVKDVYFHCKDGTRPFVIGWCTLEAFKAVPDSLTSMVDNTQKEINEVANQRLDNVKLVLNKRWIAKRGQNVDVRSITRNVPGSVTMADQVGDVVPVDFNDVTGSSYAEQDRLNVDFDELAGMFSSSTIQTNRKMNETVGGMSMLRGSANAMTEYLIRTFGETWVEPVMRQLVKMEQAYETDEVILAIAAQKAQLLQKYNIDQVTDDLLNQELTLSVNVGMGATDPMTKLERFIFAVNTLTQIAVNAPPNMKLQEVAKEVWGRLGYKDGSRFWQEGDPRLQQLQQMVQQLQGQLQNKQMETQAKLQADAQKTQVDNQTKIQLENMQQQGENLRQQRDIQADIILKEMEALIARNRTAVNR